MTTKKPATTRVENPQKSRTLRMDDDRWDFFREHLGGDWLRRMVDQERKRHAKAQQQQDPDHK